MKKRAFTLAETLITLAIIGVCATMLIKTVANLRTDDQSNSIMAEKTLGNLTNATKEIILFDTTDRSFASACKNAGAGCPMSLYQKYLSFVRIFSSAADVSSALGGKLTGAESISPANMGRLADGAIVGFVYDSTCKTSLTAIPLPGAEQVSITNACGYAFYDVNGAKGPNVLGSDRFITNIGKSGIRIKAKQ